MGKSAPSLRTPPPTSSCKGAGKRPSITVSIRVVTPDRTGAGNQESWVSDNLGIPQVLYSFSDCQGCPQGHLRAVEQAINALLDFGLMWYQPDMQTGSWHMRWTVHREKGLRGREAARQRAVGGQPEDGGQGWKAEGRRKDADVPEWHGTEVMEFGARRDTLNHTGASAQS